MAEETSPGERIADRVEALARELRWHRRAWMIVFLLAVGLGAAAFGPAKAGSEVRSTRFVLTDPNGTQRGSLGVEADGSAALKLFDSHGIERLTASVSQDASLTLCERDRKIAAKLVVEGAVPRLALSDRTGGDRLWVALRFGSPAIQFIAPDGVARSGLVTMNNDTGVAVVSGADGATPGLILYDKDKKIVWSAP